MFSKNYKDALFTFPVANFTPIKRTPWGGCKITELKKVAKQTVGESWEVSAHQAFPSKIMVNNKTISLYEMVRQYPKEILGERCALQKQCFSLLIKLLNAAQNLSLQIHPSDKTAQENESGKEESWYIISAEPGAGIYLGLAEDADEAKMRKFLDAGEDVSHFFNFIAVQPGEVYYIPPGTPHAVGAGVLLLEVQQSSATTFRYFDWNRKPSRELHINRALQETNWQLPRGNALLQTVKKEHDFNCHQLQTVCEAKHFTIKTLTLQPLARFVYSVPATFVALTVVEGSFSFDAKDCESVELAAGFSGLIPACTDELVFQAGNNPSTLVLSMPAD